MSNSLEQGVQLHFFADGILDVSGIIYPLTQIRTVQKKEISHDAVYYHFRKWSQDGSLEKV